MPIRGYIIEKYNTMTNAYTCNRLVQEASALDMDLQIVGIHDTVVSPHGVINHGKILEPVDFVINRYKWGREKDAINALATRSYNPLTAYNIYINKFEQVRRLHSKAFLIPKYLLGTSRLPFSSIVAQPTVFEKVSRIKKDRLLPKATAPGGQLPGRRAVSG